MAEGHKVTHREKLAAAQRAKARKAALAAATKEGSLLDWDPTAASEPLVAPARSLPDQEGLRAPERRRLAPSERAQEAARPKPRNPTLRFILGLTVAAAAWIVGVGLGAPLLGHGFDWRFALGGALGAAAGGWWAWKHLPEVPVRPMVISSGVFLLLVAAFTTGSFTSVVIDGKVYASNSKTAEAYHLSTDMYADLQYLASVDPLLDAEQAQARSQYTSYAPAAEKLAEMSLKWAKVASDPGALPAPLFATAATHTANASDWASKAMIRKGEIIVQPDARGEADVASYRATYVEQVQAAGPVLQEVTGYYGIDLEGSGPQE